MNDHPAQKEILQAFIREVWNEGRLEAVERYLAPRYTIHHDPGDAWEGKELDQEGFRERLRLSRAPFPDQRFEILELFGDGSAVVMTWTWKGTHRGELAGFQPSGKIVEMSGATVYYFDENERICGHWQIADRLGVFQQLRRNAGA